jgi:hypothetical protein
MINVNIALCCKIDAADFSPRRRGEHKGDCSSAAVSIIKRITFYKNSSQN